MADILKAQLEELQLIQYSLLPDENLEFVDNHDFWMEVLEKFAGDDSKYQLPKVDSGDLAFRVRRKGAEVWFEATLCSDPSISVKGDVISRGEQERWKAIVSNRMGEVAESQFPVYEVLSLHLLPMLHEEYENDVRKRESSPYLSSPSVQTERYHALLTSHHLVSPEKRRFLQRWSASLSISGFAKVGYPGIIYAEGDSTSIAEFVDNIKSMQWLALKTRFVDPLPPNFASETIPAQNQWKEFQKVGQIVDEMRRLGREQYVIEMGIGSNGCR